MSTQVVLQNNLSVPPPAFPELHVTAAKNPPQKKEVADWLETAVRRAKEKYQAERDLEERALREQALKRKLSSQFCTDLCSWLQTVEVKFNTRFGAGVLAVSITGAEDNRHIQVLAQPVRSRERVAELHYDESTNYLAFSMGYTSSAGTAQIVNLTLVDGVIMAETTQQRYTWEQFGQKLIEDLLA